MTHVVPRTGKFQSSVTAASIGQMDGPIKTPQPATPVAANGNALGMWMHRAEAKIEKNPGCVESLYVAAIKFLEQHLRSRLAIPTEQEVRIGFDPLRTRPQGHSENSQLTAKNVPAHGLPASLPLMHLHAEFNGTGSLRIITLFEDPQGRTSAGWSAIATVCVEWLQDRWCVNAILVWGEPGTQQAKAQDLFIGDRDVQNLKPQQLPAYQNSLDTDYRLPQKVSNYPKP